MYNIYIIELKCKYNCKYIVCIYIYIHTYIQFTSYMTENGQQGLAPAHRDPARISGYRWMDCWI